MRRRHVENHWSRRQSLPQVVGVPPLHRYSVINDLEIRYSVFNDLRNRYSGVNELQIRYSVINELEALIP